MPGPIQAKPERIAEIERTIARAGKELGVVTEEEIAVLKRSGAILWGGEKGAEYGGKGSLLGQLREVARGIRTITAGAKTSAKAIEKSEISALSNLLTQQGLNAVLDRLRFQYAERELGRVLDVADEISPVLIGQGVKTPYSLALARIWAKLGEQRKLRGKFTPAEWETLTGALESYGKRNPSSNIARLSEEHRKARAEQRVLWDRMKALPPGQEKDKLELSWLTRELTEMQPRWDREMIALARIADPMTAQEVASKDLALQWNRFERGEGGATAVSAPSPVPKPPSAAGKFRFAPKSGVVRPAEAPVGPEITPPRQEVTIPPGLVVGGGPPHSAWVREARQHWNELAPEHQDVLSRMLAGENVGKVPGMSKETVGALRGVADWVKARGVSFEEMTGIETLAPRRSRPVELEY